MAVAPSGAQFSISYGDQRATIVEVGGGVREYFVDQCPVLDPYPLEAICDGAHGAALIPWPNRLADGRYSWDGLEHQLALSEPDKHNAIHGLLRWRNWHALERSSERVVMGVRLYPLPGWPFPLEVAIAYSLGEHGLTVETRARNLGEGACPFGSGHHPYLSAGGGPVDDCTLELRAPAHTAFEFSPPRRLGELKLDDPFTELERDDDGLAWVRLGRPDGATVELWVDDTYPFLQLYTGDTLAPPRQRRALAAEPMTCPPNALASGEGIVRLEPGDSHLSRWGVRLR